MFLPAKSYRMRWMSVMSVNFPRLREPLGVLHHLTFQTSSSPVTYQKPLLLRGEFHWTRLFLQGEFPNAIFKSMTCSWPKCSTTRALHMAKTPRNPWFANNLIYVEHCMVNYCKIHNLYHNLYWLANLWEEIWWHVACLGMFKRNCASSKQHTLCCLGFLVDLPHNGHMLTQHIHPTPSNWWPRNPWSATLTYQTKKKWHGKQMHGGQVIKGFRVILGSRFTSWSSILNSRKLKVQAITTPTFKNYFGRIVYISGNECSCKLY